jgi:predicted ATPase/DNA-binding CsgD family transcriptional regulator
MLVTSRAVLHVQGEHEFPVPPLAVPDLRHLPPIDALSHFAAIALFLQRAQAVKPDFQLTPSNARAIVEICVRLDGLPLAIELAAARIKLLTPQALLARLGQRLAVLTGGKRDAPARQQTLRETIDWSYRLLEVYEQHLFQRLSVFVGGCTLEAIEALCAALDGAAQEVLGSVTSLLDKSLLRSAASDGEESRLTLLETIREYSLECLVASGEMETIRRAHALYYLQLAEKAALELEGPQQTLWLALLEREHDNLRAAQLWLVEQGAAGQNHTMALRLGGALLRFWIVHGYDSEGRNFLAHALTSSEGVTAPVLAKGLNAAAHLALLQDDHSQAERLCKESLALSRSLGERPGLAHSLHLLAAVAWQKGNLAAGRSMMEEALALFKQIDDKESMALLLPDLAYLISQQGEYASALALLEEGLGLSRELGDKWATLRSLDMLASLLYDSRGKPETIRLLLEECLALINEVGSKEGLGPYFGLSGLLALQQGDITKARSLLEESLVIYREVGHRPMIAWSLVLLGTVATGQGDQIAARAFYEESLSIAKELGDRLNISSYQGYLERLASLAAVQGALMWAARLWGAAEALREVLGTPLIPAYRADYEQAVVAACIHLGKQAFAVAWAEGRTMTPAQALAIHGPAIMPMPDPTEQPSPAPAKSAPTYPNDLTAREVEVLRLVAQGLTDAQIAEQLVISPRTVNNHLTSIYGKIQVASRAAATRYAIEHKLVE